MLPRLDPEELKYLYIEKGLSTLEIAKLKNATSSGIKSSLKRSGIRLRSNAGNRTQKVAGFIPTKEFMIEAASYFNNIASDAAKHYGVKYATWIDWLKKFNIPRSKPGIVLKGRPSHRRHDLPIQEAIELSNSGTTYEELSQKYGVSYGVVVRRMQEAGYKAPWRRAKDPRFNNVQSNKKKILRQLNITACEICAEVRALDFCHIKPAAGGGPIEATNCLVLCPNHHRLYDSDSLTTEEFAKIQPKVDLAKQIYGGW